MTEKKTTMKCINSDYIRLKCIEFLFKNIKTC